MNPANILKTLGSDQESRIADGEGKIHSRTIEIGDTSIAIENIGSLRLIHGSKPPIGFIFGGIALAIALISISFSYVAAVVFCFIGGALIYWNITQKVDIYLSIGTSDGRSTIIISKDISFLNDIRNFIREKIDTKNTTTATIKVHH